MRNYYCLARQTLIIKGSDMIIQNCLGLLKDLHNIEEEIACVRAIIQENGIDIDEELLLKELIKKKLGSV